MTWQDVAGMGISLLGMVLIFVITLHFFVRIMGGRR